MFKRSSRIKETKSVEKAGALVEKIKFLYESKNDLGIKNLIKNQPINLLVDGIEQIDDEQIAIRFLVGAYKIKMGELFLAFSESLKIKILNTMKSGIFAHLLDDLNSDDVYELYTLSSPSIQKKIIFHASKDLREEIKQLKEFNFAEAGSIMNTTFATLQEGMQMSEAIKFLKLTHQDFDIGEEMYVVDADEKVIGKIDIKKLFLTYLENKEEYESEAMISEITEKSYMSVFEEEDIDVITDLFKKYNIRSLAVIDQERKLVGIIDYQDIIPEILDSNIEDVYKFYGIKETEKSYLGSTIWEIVKSRITCLIIMLFAATITTLAIDKFEELGIYYTAGISTAILVPIIPIITDMCGNTGSQTTATIIQAYSSGELKQSDFWQVVRKELNVSLLIGCILAICNFIRLLIYFWAMNDPSAFRSKVHFTDETGKNIADDIADTVTEKLNESTIYKISIVGALSSSLSLWMVVIFSKFFGVLIPLVAIKFNYDPAAVSAPILTTILDTVASIIFFGIGVLMLEAAIEPIIGVSVSGGKLIA